MIPEFFQSPDSLIRLDIWKPIIGLMLVLFASFVGVEIRVGDEDEEKK
tara:strand:- start:623 stop:766 length:144 start_codon:yes stop_codon:yes gene_type:complete